MPKYNFSCKDCLHNQENHLSISEYRDLKNINLICNSCRSKNLVRVFKNTYSNIDRSTEEILAEIKNEVRSTVDKVKSGDITAISEVYGEEVNKLKVK
jgi:hypothetical protein